MEFDHGGQRISPLVRVDLAVREGERVVMKGASGSGKTTLLGILGGHLRATRGRVIVCGEDWSHMRPDHAGALRLRSVGFVFQDTNLLEHLTAVENVALVQLLLGEARETARGVASRLLHEVRAAHCAHSLPGAMSAGERQKVAVARALANRPTVILADEPTAHLSGEDARCVSELLSDMASRERAALLIATHDASLETMADRVVLLEAGELRASGESGGGPGA